MDTFNIQGMRCPLEDSINPSFEAAKIIVQSQTGFGNSKLW